MDVWEYFQTRQREVDECSLYQDPKASIYAAEDGSDGQRGRIFGRLFFAGYPETVYLRMHEAVKVRGSGITRVRYAYFLVINGREIGGYERHAKHDEMPVHKHCSAITLHERIPCRAMTFKESVQDAWRYVSEFAEPIRASA